MVLIFDLLGDKIRLAIQFTKVVVLTIPLRSHCQGSGSHPQLPPSVPAAHSEHPESDLCLLNEEVLRRCTSVCCCGEQVGCTESRVPEVREGDCPG